VVCDFFPTGRQKEEGENLGYLPKQPRNFYENKVPLHRGNLQGIPKTRRSGVAVGGITTRRCFILPAEDFLKFRGHVEEGSEGEILIS